MYRFSRKVGGHYVPKLNNHETHLNFHFAVGHGSWRLCPIHAVQPRFQWGRLRWRRRRPWGAWGLQHGPHRLRPHGTTIMRGQSSKIFWRGCLTGVVPKSDCSIGWNWNRVVATQTDSQNGNGSPTVRGGGHAWPRWQQLQSDYGTYWSSTITPAAVTDAGAPQDQTRSTAPSGM